MSKRIQVLVTVDVSGHGRVEAGFQELPDWLADMLVERGHALPLGEDETSPADENPPIDTKRRKQQQP